MKQKLHPFILQANCKSEQEFYKKYDTPEKFFKQHASPDTMPPMHKGHMQTGGFIMPAPYPAQAPVVMQDHMADGGYAARPGYHFNGNSMVKSTGSTYDPSSGNFFEYGGLRAGNQYPQYVDNPVPFPMEYGGLRAGYEYPQYSDNPVPFPAQYGGYMDSDDDIDEMKKGGFKINPAHKGWCTPMTKSTCTGKRRQFAINAKNHFKKQEDGGYIGYQQGGKLKMPADNSDPSMYDPGITAQPSTYNPSNTGVVQPYTQPTADWRQGMTDTQANQNINYGAGSTSAYDPNTGNTVAPQFQPKPNKLAYWGNQGANLLGAGIATAAYFDNMNSQQQNALYQKSLGLSDNRAHYSNPGSHGDYTQTGEFRPGQQTPSQTPQYTTMQMGGYTKGQVVDLDEQEIKALLAKGFKLTKA